MPDYILVYPPNTKRAVYTEHKFTLTVTCPHCGGIHHHAKPDIYRSYIKAPCGKGYYTLHKTELKG